MNPFYVELPYQRLAKFDIFDVNNKWLGDVFAANAIDAVNKSKVLGYPTVCVKAQ